MVALPSRPHFGPLTLPPRPHFGVALTQALCLGQNSLNFYLGFRFVSINEWQELIKCIISIWIVSSDDIIKTRTTPFDKNIYILFLIIDGSVMDNIAAFDIYYFMTSFKLFFSLIHFVRRGVKQCCVDFGCNQPLQISCCSYQQANIYAKSKCIVYWLFLFLKQLNLIYKSCIQKKKYIQYYFPNIYV